MFNELEDGAEDVFATQVGLVLYMPEGEVGSQHLHYIHPHSNHLRSGLFAIPTRIHALHRTRAQSGTHNAQLQTEVVL